MFEAIDKMIEESVKITEGDKDVAAVIRLFDSISEGEVPPQFAKFVKGKDGDSDADKEEKGEDTDDDEDEKGEDEEVTKESKRLIAHFNRLSEGDQERLDKSDDADKGEAARSGEEQPAKGEKSGGPKDGANGEVDSDAGVKKDTEDALVDWTISAMIEADELTQDHEVHNQGLRGAIGDANDGDGNKDDALPDSDDEEAKPDNAKKLIDKSGGVSEDVLEDWMLCSIIESK